MTSLLHFSPKLGFPMLDYHFHNNKNNNNDKSNNSNNSNNHNNNNNNNNADKLPLPYIVSYISSCMSSGKSRIKEKAINQSINQSIIQSICHLEVNEKSNHDLSQQQMSGSDISLYVYSSCGLRICQLSFQRVSQSINQSINQPLHTLQVHRIAWGCL